MAKRQKRGKLRWIGGCTCQRAGDKVKRSGAFRGHRGMYSIDKTWASAEKAVKVHLNGRIELGLDVSASCWCLWVVVDRVLQWPVPLPGRALHSRDEDG